MQLGLVSSWGLVRTLGKSPSRLGCGLQTQLRDNGCFTGVEDYFDSAYWFCALGGMGPCLFAHPNSGLLHFSRTAFNGTDVINGGRPTSNTPKNDSIWSTTERLSAYRFFDQEVVGFTDGGALHWRVGDVGDKCSGCPPGAEPIMTPLGLQN